MGKYSDEWRVATYMSKCCVLFAGTVVAMEKEQGILKEEHKMIIETLRDQIEKELQQCRDKKPVISFKQ